MGEEGPEAFAELVGGLFGEGGEVDVLGRDAVEDEEVEGAPEEDARFPGAGARGDVEGAGGVADGRLLFWVGGKVGEIEEPVEGLGWPCFV